MIHTTTKSITVVADDLHNYQIYWLADDPQSYQIYYSSGLWSTQLSNLLQ